MKAVIFDFNGTLFFDSDINEWAWRQTINELSDNKIDFDKVYQEYKSVRNYIFVKNVFIKLGYELDDEKINYWVKRKETKYYHQFCYENNRKDLAPGAKKLLNYLKDNNIPINLCTSSIIENINLYFDYIGIGEWFDKDIIVYDDGNFDNKIKMYQKAADNINTNIKDCLVFEDSTKSLKEAIAAGCNNIVAIHNDIVLPEIKQNINDFKEFDYSLLWKN